MSMSGEQISIDRNVETLKKEAIETKKSNSVTSNRVNINHLMSKVRDEEKKQRKENLIFFSLIGSVIIITGIIASF
tara:strand:+ start:428 stop:655 length:228 start_codon:yes stop_codon:yes gene_type:complete